VFVAALWLPARAWASTPGGPSQVPGNPATQVPRVADGPGLKAGKNSTFHGGAALSIGFDSNVFSESRDQSPARAAFALPSVWLTIGNRPVRNGVLDSPPKRTKRKVDYHFGLLAGWRLNMSGNRRIWQASKLNLGFGTRVMFAPGRKFSFAIEDDLYRLGEPINFEAGRSLNFNRVDNSAALRFILRPSGGRISLDVAYRNDILAFESSQHYRSNRLVNGVETETKYRFRDRSALAVRYSYHYTYYFCCTEPGTGRNEDSHAHRVLGGYVGQLGKRLVLEVMGGWGWGLYKQDTTGPDHKNFIGYAALGVFPTRRTSISLRLGRHFRDSIFGNYMTDIGGSIAAEHMFNFKMRINAGLGVYQRRYAGLPIPGGDTQDILAYENADGFVRRDTLISFNLQLEQPFGKYLVVGARYALAADLSDFVVIYPGETEPFANPARFTRNLLMAFVAVRY